MPATASMVPRMTVFRIFARAPASAVFDSNSLRSVSASGSPSVEPTSAPVSKSPAKPQAHTKPPIRLLMVSPPFRFVYFVRFAQSRRFGYSGASPSTRTPGTRSIAAFVTVSKKQIDRRLSMDDGESSKAEDLSFPQTSWGRILPGHDARCDPETNALEALAQSYWRPIHAWLCRALRRRPDEAMELTQDFFVWMIETDFLHKADPNRGRFRSFLKTALRHFVADSDRRRLTLKRGGDRRQITIHETEPGAWAPEIADPSSQTPDEILDAAWRNELVHLALRRLEEELAASGKDRMFAVFRDYVIDPDRQTDYRSLADRHRITTTNVSNYLSRARARYRVHLKSLVTETVATPSDLEEELAWLFGRAGRS